MYVFLFAFSMIGTLFPLPRILYSMASDGLLFNIFSKVDTRTKTPFWGTLICGFFAGKYQVEHYFMIDFYFNNYTSYFIR